MMGDSDKSVSNAMYPRLGSVSKAADSRYIYADFKHRAFLPVMDNFISQ